MHAYLCMYQSSDIYIYMYICIYVYYICDMYQDTSALIYYLLYLTLLCKQVYTVPMTTCDCNCRPHAHFVDVGNHASEETEDLAKQSMFDCCICGQMSTSLSERPIGMTALIQSSSGEYDGEGGRWRYGRKGKKEELDADREDENDDEGEKCSGS